MVKGRTSLILGLALLFFGFGSAEQHRIPPAKQSLGNYTARIYTFTKQKTLKPRSCFTKNFNLGKISVNKINR